MSRTDSPLRDRVLFAFGAQRSGTFWLQRLLTAHPLVSAVPSETYLFELGIKPLLERFHQGARSSPTVGQLYVEQDVLLDATRDFCDAVLAPHLDSGARYLSERSPGHAGAVDVINAVYPDARLVHIVRDGRDVARSLVARDWGPTTVADAARTWRDAVRSARAWADLEGYREVRYEDLLADPRAGARELYEWLGLPAGDDVLDLADAAAARPINADPLDPRLARDKWRDHFSPGDLAAFEGEAGDLLAELGYADGAQVIERSAAPPRRRGLFRRETATQVVSEAKELGGLPAAQAVADELLAALHTGGEGIAALLPDGVRMRVVSAAGEEEITGSEHVERALAQDPAWTGRQVRGETFPGTPNFTLVLTYELGGAERVVRVLALSVPRGRVEALTLYRL